MGPRLESVRSPGRKPRLEEQGKSKEGMMGSLTADMTRLCGEINDLRQVRGEEMRDRRQEMRDRKMAVSEMRADFAFAGAAMARKTKADLATFVSDLKAAVDELKCAVGELREQFRTDVAGAHRAWLAPALAFEMPSAKAPPVKPAKFFKRKR